MRSGRKKGECSLGREEKDYLGSRTDTAERFIRLRPRVGAGKVKGEGMDEK